jgi:hypothetical protein
MVSDSKRIILCYFVTFGSAYEPNIDLANTNYISGVASYGTLGHVPLPQVRESKKNCLMKS